MNTNMRIIIIVLVVILVGGIMLIKNRGTDNEPQAPPSTITSDREAASSPSSSAPASPAGAKLPRLVDLGASTCIPCKMMAPILEQLKKEYAGRMEVEFIDVWKNPTASDRYGVRMIPTQIFFDASGKELFRHEGFYSREDILRKWKELGVDIGKKPVDG